MATTWPGQRSAPRAVALLLPLGILALGIAGELGATAPEDWMPGLMGHNARYCVVLVPLMAAMGSWGLRHTNPAADLASGAQVLEEGGPLLWEQFMQELRHIHLGAPPPDVSAFARMEAAYEAVVATEMQAGQVARVA